MTDTRSTPPPESPAAALSGEVAYIFAYDVAYEMPRQVEGMLLGRPVQHFSPDPRERRDSRAPLFYRPGMVRIPERTCLGPHGPASVRWTVKLYPVGAISITVHVPFSGLALEDLRAYHDAALDGQPIDSLALAAAQQALDELRPQLDRPVAALAADQAYVVFCLASDDPQAAPLQAARGWLADNRRAVAGLLNQEDDAQRLSEQEVEDTVANPQSYYRHDLVLMDWDAALIIDQRRGFSEVLHAIELASVQLAELEVYDRLLDASLQAAYRDMTRRSRARSQVLASLREIRVDLARLGDELSNVGKFFGDWHLAKVYRRMAQLLHLEDWRRTIGHKLTTLDSLYQILKQDQVNRLLVILELSVVVIFIIDLVLVFIGLLASLH